MIRTGDEVVITNHPKRSTWSAFGVVKWVDGNKVCVETPLAAKHLLVLTGNYPVDVKGTRTIVTYLKHVMLVQGN